MAKRQIIALGGGGFSMEPDNPFLDAYVLAQAGKPSPKVCFFPHAGYEADAYARKFYDAFAKLDCRPSWLSIFWPSMTDIASFVLSQDVIYVGGGNTKMMLAMWREWGLDEILRAAYERGIVLAGVSAGANCWFEACLSDWRGDGSYRAIPCLGLLSGAYSPHYDGESGRRPALHACVASGEMPATIACDDGVAAHFVDNELVRVVSSRPHAKAFRVERDANGNVTERALDTRFLGE